MNIVHDFFGVVVALTHNHCRQLAYDLKECRRKRGNLTPSRRIWQHEAKDCKENCRWCLHGQRNAPLQVPHGKCTGIAKPSGKQVADGVHPSLQTDQEASVLRRRKLGKIDGGHRVHHAGRESREGTSDDHHGHVLSKGLDDGTNDGNKATEEDGPPA